MPVELQPPELARLADFAERPRADDWSFRAALVRYAQPEPERVAAVVELIRRIEWALRAESKVLEQEGPALWAVLADGVEPSSPAQRRLTGVLAAAVEMDRLGDVIATWAVDRAEPRPLDEVDRVTTDVTQRLDAIGVPREDPDAFRGRRG